MIPLPLNLEMKQIAILHKPNKQIVFHRLENKTNSEEKKVKISLISIPGSVSLHLNFKILPNMIEKLLS